MKKVIVLVVVLLLVGGIGFGVWRYFPQLVQKADPGAALFLEDANNLIKGLQQYKEFIGSYPTGGPVEIAKALTGQSEKKVLILVAKPNDLNAKGEIVDPWGTPVKIYFAQKEIVVRSAGPNKIFEDSRAVKSDDLYRSN